jgi:hypothetical protein
MSWRLRLSVETILRLTPAVLGSTVFSIAGLCAAHACLDDQALLAAREAIGSSLHTSEFRGFSPPPTATKLWESVVFYVRSDLKPARSSSLRNFGCSNAAKCPPLGSLL